MKVSELNERVGGLSSTGKMPWLGYSIPATACKVGAILQKRIGSVCHDCYALKGRYTFPVVIQAMERRLQATKTTSWVSNMIELIGRKAGRVTQGKRYFRWHDSGDIQNSRHLLDILEIARQLPDVKFWLPTKEYGLVRQLSKSGSITPDNICIRVSAPDVNSQLDPTVYGPVSDVKDNKETFSTSSFPCHATAPTPDNPHQCGSCRACWDTDIKSVTYFKH